MNRTTGSILPGFLVTGVLSLATAVMFTAARAEQARDAVSDVSRGATGWSQNCGRCHALRSPTEFRDDLWKPIMAHMRIRAGLTGQQQRDILAFLQASNNPALLQSSSAKDNQVTTGTTLSGKEIYDETCVACHGADGRGAIPGTPDFSAREGPLSKTDGILTQHITRGFQTPGSPMAMPALGGNPHLSATDVRSVLAYIRETFGPR